MPIFDKSADDGCLLAVAVPKEGQSRCHTDDGCQLSEFRRLERHDAIAQPALGPVDSDAKGFDGEEQENAGQEKEPAPMAQPLIAQMPDSPGCQQADDQEAQLLQEIAVDRAAAV